MMSLVPFELKKLLKKKSVLGALVVLLLGLSGLFYMYFLKSPIAGGSNGRVSGHAAVELNQKIAEKHTGFLTDDLVNQIFQDYIAEKKEFGFLGFYNDVSQSALGELIVDSREHLIAINDAAQNNAIDTTTFDAVRLRTKKELSSALELDKLKFGNFAPWDYLFTVLNSGFILLILFVVFICSAVFSEDKARQIDSLLLTTKKGRNQLTIAKFIASLSITVLSFVGLYVVVLLVFASYFGFSGWDTSVQMNLHWITPFSTILAFPVAMNLVEILGWLAIYHFIGILFILGITFFISSKTKTSMVTFAVSSGFVFAIEFLLQAFPSGIVNKLLTLFSVSTNGVETLLLKLASHDGFFLDNFVMNNLLISVVRLLCLGVLILLTYMGVRKVKS
ncbi:ABC transporter permease subunit [Streptococcus himalayensis]|uniref:Membrane protein n=1 Tax=Streptococcus himalayensis TaxID=1888195 RepID=A0A917EFZ6_9STRE|nr:ABC transporter permease subunit [Streptococcus himalayensis]GGE29072.1 membrane protein [Streptococcus himalayensis]